MIKICFVTPELHPFTPGGIGVLIHNIIRNYTEDDVQFHVMSVSDWGISEEQFRAIFPGCVYWQWDRLVGEQDPAFHPPEQAFTTHEWHYRSYRVAQALQTLAGQGVEFDFVEFPDWGGLAFCSCQEKLLGNKAVHRIAVRLHSTDSILRPDQPVAGGASAAHLADLERKSLRDADIVIAHIATVAEATRVHFGFDAAWSDKVRVEAPPVGLLAQGADMRFHAETPLCFPSKIQHLKRPEVFLNGALAFLNRTPEYRGDIVFMAYPTDEKLAEKLASRAASHLADRVRFLPYMPPEARNAVLSTSISIFPSPFESFCLTAYETSLQGGWVTLNDANPAFADGTGWTKGINCLKFDGTALGLADCLEQAWCERASLRFDPVRHAAADAPYWLSFAEQKDGPGDTEADPPLVSIIIPYFNMGAYILRTLESVLRSSYKNLEIVLVDDCSDDPSSRDVLESIRRDSSFGWLSVVSAPANVGLAAARNLGIRAAKGRYILTIDADDLIRRHFIEVAVRALENNPEYSIVVPQTAFISDADTSENMTIIDHAIFIGEAFRSGSFYNRFSTATSLGRRTVYEQFPYDENFSLYEDWDFYSRIAWAGHRFIVSSDVYFYYRRRPDSMIANNNSEKHIHNMSRLRAHQRICLDHVAFDMNVVTDAEAHLSQQGHVFDLLRQANARLAVAQSIFDKQVASIVVGKRLQRVRGFLGRIREEYRIRRAVRDLDESGLFDRSWYLSAYSDVAAAGMDPARHFILHGRGEGRAPNPVWAPFEVWPIGRGGAGSAVQRRS